MEKQEYYSFQDILKFLNFDYEFDRKNKEYPFYKGKENVEFSWGQVLIPKYGIKQMVQNKVSDIKENPLKEITMMYQVPFVVEGKTGIINKNISLSFRYDKEYKYGKVTKSIYECCFWILEHAIKTNDFYIITEDLVQNFFSYCVINNQWGLGSLKICTPPQEKFEHIADLEEL